MPRVRRAAAMPPGTPELPVLIVGAGACGLSAALGLRDAGIDCALLERNASAGGSTALSSGFVPAAGTAVQRAAGVANDSPARFAQDIQAKAKGTAAAHLVAAYTEAIAPALDTLQARHGLRFELVDGFLYPGHSVRRMHTLPQRTGAALIAALDVAATDAGAIPLYRTRAQELWCDETGRVHGVGCLKPDGRSEHMACRVLLLACNGFAGNAAMVRELLPEMHDAAFGGHAGNDGSAIAWGRQLGARLADLGGYQGHGSWAVPHGVLISWALMMEGGIQVNAEGRRFHDERGGYSEASVQVLAQPGGIAWNVIDERLLDMAQHFPDFVAAQQAGAVRRADGAEALAALIGCDTATLAATLAGTALHTPYFAIRVTGALFHTQGGLDIDARCRVLREDGAPLPNLLAAGGAARGVSGNAVWGYLSGNGLLSAIAGGQIAARTAAQLLGETS
ncbi:MAG: FAD-dependent oxidoreductase [Rhizobacter sp.]|nr:FAD-dependent oxidoreductase [Rhizobacter sp.]